MSINYSISYTFSPATTISSSQVNQNFTDNSNTWNGLEAKTKTFSNLGVDTQLKSGGTIESANGTAGAPSITFSADTATGFFRSSSTVIGVGTSNTIAMGSSKITGLASGTAATDAVAYSQVNVVQAVTTTTTTATSTTGAVFTNCTNMQVTITPTSASNKVIIQVWGMFEIAATAANQTMMLTVTRGGTNIGDSTNGFYLYNSSAAVTAGGPFSLNYLDSPASTSAQQYILQLKSDGTRTSHWNRLTLPAMIRVMEVQA